MKKWETPELIVLARSRPEEAVLGNCKQLGGNGPGPTYGACTVIADPGGAPYCISQICRVTAES